MGYPGQFEENRAIHAALATLRPGDRLNLRHDDGGGAGLYDRQGTCVARFSQKATAAWSDRLGAVREVRVLAMVHRSRDQDEDPVRRDRYRVAEWEVPVLELVYAESPSACESARET